MQCFTICGTVFPSSRLPCRRRLDQGRAVSLVAVAAARTPRSAFLGAAAAAAGRVPRIQCRHRPAATMASARTRAAPPASPH